VALNKKLWEEVNNRPSIEPDDKSFDPPQYLEPHLIEGDTDEDLEQRYRKRLEEAQEFVNPYDDRMLSFIAREMKKRFRAGIVKFDEGIVDKSLEKIEGQLLRVIDFPDGQVKIEYVESGGGKLRWFQVSTNSDMITYANAAERFLPQARIELAQTTDAKRIRELKHTIEHDKIQLLKPDIYIAHVHGEGLGRFFTMGTAKIKEPDARPKNVKKKKRHTATDKLKAIRAERSFKYEIIKKAVDKLYEEGRSKDLKYSKYKAIQDYAEQTGDTFDNVNKTYYSKHK
jgi:hypothetical protein